MRIRLMTVLAVLLAVGSLAGFAASADAASAWTGRFNWAVDTKRSYQSEFWSQVTKSGTVEIQSACTLTNGESYTIDLREYTGGSWDSLGKRTYRCSDTLESHTWAGVRGGGRRYYFVLTLTKSHTSKVHFSGNVFYP